jgi:hypothetical protein
MKALIVIGVVVGGLTFGSVTLWKRTFRSPRAALATPTRKVGCLPIDARIHQALAGLPPEAYARMPLKSAPEVERFVSANLEGIDRAVRALAPQARPDYHTAKQCFATNKPRRGTTALLEWKLTATAQQLELAQPSFHGTTSDAETETTRAARDCSQTFMGKTYRVIVPTDQVAAHGFFDYQGSVILPVRFGE